MTESKFAEKTKAVGKLFGTAAQLAQKQAALATLNNVTLPKLYHAIGKKIVGPEKLPADLVPHRERIRALEAGIAAKPEELPAAPAEGFAAKAKHLAQQAAQKASKATADATATMQIQAAYVALGKEAVEKYGEKAIPQDLAGEFAAACETRESLVQQVTSLRDSSRLGILTPMRLLFTAAALVGVGATFFLLRSGSRSTESGHGETHYIAVPTRTESPTQADQANSDTGTKDEDAPSWLGAIPSHEQVAEEAVRMATYPDSDFYEQTSFRGIELGARYPDELPAGLSTEASPLSPHLITLKTDDQESQDRARNLPPARTSVFVDKASSRVVGISCQYVQTPLDRIKESIFAVFGKPLRPVEVTEFASANQIHVTTRLGYGFPKTTVRVQEVDTLSKQGAGQRTNTMVQVFDAAWVKQNLEGYVSRLMSDCEWVDSACRAFVDGQFDLNRIPELPNTRRWESGSGQQLVLYDKTLEAIAAQQPASTPEPLWVDPVIAIVGQLDDGAGEKVAVVMVRSSHASVSGLLPLLALGPASAPKTLVESGLVDLVGETTRFIVEDYFRPNEDVMVLKADQTVHGTAFFRNSQPPYDFKRLARSTRSSRSEWEDILGWTVRTGVDGWVCRVLRRQRSLED